jgi:cytochrome c553
MKRFFFKWLRVGPETRRATAWRVRTLVALLVLAFGSLLVQAGGAFAQAHCVPDTLAQRLQACATCHGREGRASNSGYQPRIAGKPAGYVFNQLMNFRAGRRSNAAMTALTDNLTESYLREIAEHYASLDLPYPPAQTRDASPALLARGQQLVTEGDKAQKVPACARCHGSRLTGLQPSIPGLLGLPRDYISAQLGAWQTGLRRAQAPDCMASVAKKLKPGDVAALAVWLSSQSLPNDAHPMAASLEPLPQDCGESGH